MSRPKRRRSSRRSGTPGQSRSQNRRRRQPRAKRAARGPAPPSIARTFWGETWCKNIESFRVSRSTLALGRTYMRHDAVQTVNISSGKIQAAVKGMEEYFVTIEIDPLEAQTWKTLHRQCLGRDQNLGDLLAGRLSRSALARLSDRRKGLFPRAEEIGFDCTCDAPDGICEHVFAVLYAVALHLDSDPKLFFVLRGIELDERTQSPAVSIDLDGSLPWHPDLLTDPDLEGIFGIALSDFTAPSSEADSAPDAQEQPAPDPAARRTMKKMSEFSRSASRSEHRRQSPRSSRQRSRGVRAPKRSSRRTRNRRQ